MFRTVWDELLNIERLDIHLIVDNHATHKHDKVKEWLGKHPRFKVHFTPTSASWLKQIKAGII